MRAIRCTKLGIPDDLSIEDIAIPAPGAGELRIRVAAVGINFPDLLLVSGQYQEKPDLPFTPGLEVSGLIDAVGVDVAGFAVGDRVCAFLTGGGFAEYTVAGVYQVFKISDKMPFVTAAGMPVIFTTAHHALKRRARLSAGETLLVLGAAGGVGSAAIQIGKALGATVIAAARGAGLQRGQRHQRALLQPAHSRCSRRCRSRPGEPPPGTRTPARVISKRRLARGRDARLQTDAVGAGSTRKIAVPSSAVAGTSTAAALAAKATRRRCPSSTKPSPSARARVAGAAASPDSASSSAAVRIASPAATLGSQAACWASLPNSARGRAAVRVASAGSGAVARPTSSSSRHSSVKPKPMPPWASGIATPSRLAWARVFHRAWSVQPADALGLP